MTSSSAFQAVLVDQPDEDLSFLPETCWRTGSDGRWFDPEWLYESLRNGSVKLSDDFLQMQFLDYIEKQERCEFYNTQTHEFYYPPVAKRGNLPYAIKKGKVCDEIVEAMSKICFDEPVPGFRNLRRTRLLFATITFDPEKFTQEDSWMSLKSTRPEGTDHKYNVINGLNSNLERVFGSEGKLVSKEAQANGYPAPHLLIVLDKPVLVRRKKIKGDIYRWFIEDEEILRKIGKDKASRELYRKDYRKAIDSNPIWKHGFFDIEGVVSEQKFLGRKNVCRYLFKYMSKCITKDGCHLTSSLRTIKDCRDHNTKVMLYTHLCNKCFNNRDITYGKGFKDRIGLLSKQQKENDSDERSPWTYLGNIDEGVFQEKLRNRLNSDPPDEEAISDPV